MVVMREIGVRQRGSYICATLRANAQGGTMKRFVIAAAVCGLALSGCGGGSDAAAPGPKATATVTETAPVSPSPTPEPVAQPSVPDRLPIEQGLALAREQEAMLRQVSDATIIDVAKADCETLDRGVSARKIVTTGIKSGGVTPEVVGVLLGFAVYSFCPEYIADAQGFAG